MLCVDVVVAVAVDDDGTHFYGMTSQPASKLTASNCSGMLCLVKVVYRLASSTFAIFFLLELLSTPKKKLSIRPNCWLTRQGDDRDNNYRLLLQFTRHNNIMCCVNVLVLLLLVSPFGFFLSFSLSLSLSIRIAGCCCCCSTSGRKAH